MPKASFWSPAGNGESKSLERATGNYAAFGKFTTIFLTTIMLVLVFHLRVIFKFYISFFLRVCICVCVLLNTPASSFDVKIVFFVWSKVLTLIVDSVCFFFTCVRFSRFRIESELAKFDPLERRLYVSAFHRRMFRKETKI